jgi:hypothetical protein
MAKGLLLSKRSDGMMEKAEVKKEYKEPQMDILNLVVRGSLLEGSPDDVPGGGDLIVGD